MDDRYEINPTDSLSEIIGDFIISRRNNERLTVVLKDQIHIVTQDAFYGGDHIAIVSLIHEKLGNKFHQALKIIEDIIDDIDPGVYSLEKADVHFHYGWKSDLDPMGTDALENYLSNINQYLIPDESYIVMVMDNWSV